MIKHAGENRKSSEEFWWVMPIVAIAIWNGMGKNSAIAQLIPDGSLGTESSSVVPLDGLSDRIDGGAIRGGNLFHSFQEFNIDAGRGAFFSNPAAIENILTRVTGGNPSNIFGTLGVLGEANLFLVNPSGIVFGPDARLDVGGSFFASTAEGILFPDGYEFSAANPDAPPLLTINVPVGLQFGANPGGIEVRGMGLNRPLANVDGVTDIPTLVNNEMTFLTEFFANPAGLQVRPGRTLGFVGGNVTLTGGLLKAPAGRVELGSAGSNGMVSLTPTPAGITLGYEDVENFGDISLSQQTAIATSGDGGGNIQIQGRQFRQSDRSQIRADNLGSQPGGTVTIRASESVEVLGSTTEFNFPSSIVTSTLSDGSAGNTTVETERLTVRDGAVVGVATLGSGPGGNLTIRADESIDLTGSFPGRLFPTGLVAGAFASGDAGNTRIETGRLTVSDGSAILVGTGAQGDGGTLTVRADTIDLAGGEPDAVLEIPGGIIGNSFDVGDPTGERIEGDAGNIDIQARELVVREGAVVAAIAQGDGSSGNILLEVDRLVVLDGGSVSVETQENGAGGNLQIWSEDIELIGVRVDEEGDETPGGLSAGTTGDGDAGNIEIETNRLTVRDGAAIAAATTPPFIGFNSFLNEGQGGSITIRARDIELSGTSPNGSFSIIGSVTQGLGDAGQVSIETDRFVVRNGAQVNVSTLSEGFGGILEVRARDIELSGTSPNGSPTLIGSATGGLGDAGQVSIETDRFVVRDGAQVSVGTLSEGFGGILEVRARDIELDGTSSEAVEVNGDSQFQASGFFTTTRGTTDVLAVGNAGDAIVETDRLVVRDGAQISAGTVLSQGDGGNVTVRAQDIQLIGVSPNGNLSSAISAASAFFGRNAGNVSVETDRLVVRDGASIGVAAFLSQGNAGTIEVRASESVELNGTSPDGQSISLLAAGTFNVGNAGDITVETGRLTVRDGGQVVAGTVLSDGEAGNITIRADAVELGGTTLTGVSSSLLATTFSAGNAGSVNVEADRLTVRDGGEINVSGGSTDLISELNQTQLQDSQIQDIQTLQIALILLGLDLEELSTQAGIPGNINITSSVLRLDDRGALNATSEIGQGGSINLNSGSVQLLGESLISAAGSETGTTFEGNIDIRAETLALLDRSQIITNAFDPQGGSNITIRPRNRSNLGIAIFQSDDSLINAEGDLTIEGDIEFDPAEVPDIETTDVTSLISQGCQDYEGSEFYITGRGGLPPNPRDIRPGTSLVELDWVEDETESAIESSQRPDRPFTQTEHPSLIEAQGWYTNEIGQVVLTANPISPTSHSSGIAAVDCHTVEDVRSPRERSN